MDVRSILSQYDITPSKGLGQHFLTDERTLERILETASIGKDDVIVEVGSGIGLLTRRMAQRAAYVLAVELDRKMIRILQDSLGRLANVHLITGDILKVVPAAEIARALGTDKTAIVPYKVVGNLPYYITSAILRHLLTADARPTHLTVMVQHEVAKRIIAQPGKSSLLAMSVQVFGVPTLVLRVPAGAFYPRPKVDSALMSIDVFEQPMVSAEESERFFRVLHAGFGQKRKQLHNSLSHGLRRSKAGILAALDEADVDPTRRPQTLNVHEWVRLTRVLLPDRCD